MEGEMTRAQAVAQVGENAVAAVERENCEPTGRVGYNGKMHGDDLTEWSASIGCHDKDGDEVTLTAYYYTDHDEDQAIADAYGDGSVIDWEIAGYEIV